MSSNAQQAVQQILTAYRRRTSTRAGLQVLLAAACLTAVLWRCRSAGLDRVWWWSLVTLGGVSLCVWLWWIAKQRHRLLASTPLELDRALGLHARLVTAVEFANAQHPPSLYGELLEDTAQSLTASSKRLPRVADHLTVALLVALLLLIWWPLRRASPIQLAMHTPTAPTTDSPSLRPPDQPPTPQPSPTPSAQDQSRQGQGQGDSGQGAGQPQQRDSSAGQAGQSSSQSGNQQPQAGQQASSQQGSNRIQDIPSASGAQHAQPQSQDGSQRQQTQGSSRTQSPQQAQAQPSSSQGSSAPSASKAADASKSSQNNASGAQQAQQTAASGKQADASQQAAKQANAASEAKSSQEANASGHSGSRASLQQAKAGATGGSQVGQGQEATKEDIQRLLKEMSGELQQLQAQLTEEHREQLQMPGSTTDPDLFDKQGQLPDQAASRSLPIQLGVDAQATSKKRAGSGTGAAAQEIDDATPQQVPEDAQLSTERAEDPGASRRRVPPEYRSVFERLSHSSSSTQH